MREPARVSSELGAAQVSSERLVTTRPKNVGINSRGPKIEFESCK